MSATTTLTLVWSNSSALIQDDTVKDDTKVLKEGLASRRRVGGVFILKIRGLRLLGELSLLGRFLVFAVAWQRYLRRKLRVEGF